MREARGVWFTGGRQWRIVDVFGDTPAVPLFHEVLKRGGVIGGSSAGASIQGDYMGRGDPLGNLDMMAEGYEEGSRFCRRRRRPALHPAGAVPDMRRLMAAHPNCSASASTNSTAFVVHGSTLEVVGQHQVHIYNRRAAPSDDRDHESLPAGARYDLKERKLLTSE